MTPSLDTPRRRSILQFVGAAAGTGALGSIGDLLEPDDDRSFVLEQGGDCVELEPLSGDEPVEEFYDYRYPTSLFDSVSGSNGSTYSSEGTTDLQRDATSILFLYDGPEGLSLVVVHGHLDGDDDGGTVTFDLEGVPADAEWVVRDDYYLEDGEQADSNYDRWDVDGTSHQVDWAYRGGRTDGGALRGIEKGIKLLVDPGFNDEAALAPDHHYGPIESWEALSGDRDSPERTTLQLDEPITIRAGPCDASDAVDETDEHAPDEEGSDAVESDAGDDQTDVDGDDGTGDGDEDGTDDGDDESDDHDGPGGGRGEGRGRGQENGRARGHEKGRGRGHEKGRGRGHQKHH